MPLVAILGPTASGKSALAVALAGRLGGEVIACDSTQVYRGCDIGTAKPSADERRHIAHHMIDLVPPTEVFSAGEYRKLALEVLADLRQRNRLPIFTVGTGLYFRALMEGLTDAPSRSDRLRARLNATGAKRGGIHLHKILCRLDPAAAKRISPNDRQKLVRAVEVCLLAGQPLSELHRAGRRALQGYAALKIGLHPPRQALYERIERRVQLMLDHGWSEEVAALVAEGAPKAAKLFEFIGYRELLAQSKTGQPVSNTVGAIAQATRRYAKRQLTWFRRESGVQWFAGFGDAPETLAAALGFLAPLLRQSQDSAGHRGPRDAV
ncbi:MAG: tRNA (adenosine(37)-N6)-dimethylallyltransferase MiaA [Acidobacteria bacterium]|nr:MAG: tRNA (adenosine(37)-N6)-dimethylallyltransferase MiaA [Acidobacteriota bacterium]